MEGRELDGKASENSQASLSHSNHKKDIDRSTFIHKCKECTKRFQKPSQLVRHMRIHTGEKPFQCPTCGKAFSQKGSLQIHMTKHSGVKPFTCEVCSAGFRQRWNLQVHVLKVHTKPESGEQIFRCRQCPCVFRKVGSLNSHMSRVHMNASSSVISNCNRKRDKEGNILVSTGVDNAVANDEEKEFEPVVTEVFIKEEPEEYPEEFDEVQNELVDEADKEMGEVDQLNRSLEEKLLEEQAQEKKKKKAEYARNYRAKKKNKEKIDAKLESEQTCSDLQDQTSTIDPDLAKKKRIRAERNKRYQAKRKQLKKESSCTGIGSGLDLHVRGAEKKKKKAEYDRNYNAKKKAAIHESEEGIGREKGEASPETISHRKNLARIRSQNYRDRKGHRSFHFRHVVLSTPVFVNPGVDNEVANDEEKELEPEITEVFIKEEPEDYPEEFYELHNEVSPGVDNAVANDEEKEFEPVIAEVFIKEEPQEYLEEYVDVPNEGNPGVDNEVANDERKEFEPVVTEVYIVPDKIVEDDCVTQEIDPLAELPCLLSAKTNLRGSTDIPVTNKKNCKNMKRKKNGDANIEDSNEREAITLKASCENEPIAPTSTATDDGEPKPKMPKPLPDIINIKEHQHRVRPAIKTVAERCKAYRQRKKLWAQLKTPPLKPPPKSASERGKAFRERKKLQKTSPNAIISLTSSPESSLLTTDDASVASNPDDGVDYIKHEAHLEQQPPVPPPPPKTAAERCKAYRERKKLRAQQAMIAQRTYSVVTDTSAKPAVETAAERCEEYRERKKNRAQQAMNATKTDSGSISTDFINEEPEENHEEFDEVQNEDRERQLRMAPKLSHGCTHCPKSFNKPSDLARHVLSHTGERPYACEKCGRSFMVKCSLESHLLTHAPDGVKDIILLKYPCHVCGCLFATNQSLKLHMRTHTGARPFKCPSCGLSFCTSGHLKSHISSHLRQQSLLKKDFDCLGMGKMRERSSGTDRRAKAIAMDVIQSIDTALQDSDTEDSEVEHSSSDVVEDWGALQEKSSKIIKTPAQRSKEYRDRKKLIQASTSTDNGTRSIKTTAQRSKEYRERKKSSQADASTSGTSSTKVVKTNAQSCKEYRDRTKLIQADASTSGTRSAKTPAQRSKEYRERKKSNHTDASTSGTSLGGDTTGFQLQLEVSGLSQQEDEGLLCQIQEQVLVQDIVDSSKDDSHVDSNSSEHNETLEEGDGEEQELLSVIKQEPDENASEDDECLPVEPLVLIKQEPDENASVDEEYSHEEFISPLTSN